MATNANGNLRTKVEFPTNIPTQIKLDYDAPKLAPGRNGDQWQYIVNDNAGIMWLDPAVKALIDATGAKAGDQIIITKAERRNGTKRAVEWRAEKLEEQPAAADEYDRHMAAQPQPAPRTNGAPAAIAPASTAPKATQPPPAIAPPATVATAPAPAEETPEHAPYFHAFRLAIDTARDVEAYAAGIGRPVAFTSEDIRSMAATLYIQGRR